MKKKTSAVAIIVAVIFSILLFPFVVMGGIGSATVFSVESMVVPDREEDIYDSLVKNGGMDYIYDLVIIGLEDGLGEEAAEFGLEAEEFFPREQVESIVYDVYHCVIKGEEYQLDLSYQKDVMRATMMEYFDANIENEIRAQYGTLYDMLDESQKAAAMEAARVIYVAEMDSTIEEEFSALEVELSAEVNSIYDMPEYQELKELEAEYGYSLTDRTELCRDIRLAGYVLLGLTGFFLALLLLCHLFRPSGFFTAGAFSLLTGGLLFAVAKGGKSVLMSLISSELSAELSMETLPTGEFTEFIMPMVEDVLGWCMTGFEKVGKIGLMAAVILILVGILLLVIRKNKAEAEPVSAVEMQ